MTHAHCLFRTTCRNHIPVEKPLLTRPEFHSANPLCNLVEKRVFNRDNCEIIFEIEQIKELSDKSVVTPFRLFNHQHKWPAITDAILVRVIDRPPTIGRVFLRYPRG